MVTIPQTDVTTQLLMQAMDCGGDACTGCVKTHAFKPIDDLLQPVNRTCPDPAHHDTTISHVAAPFDQWKVTPFRHICSAILRAFGARNHLSVPLRSQAALGQWTDSVSYLRRTLRKSIDLPFHENVKFIQSYFVASVVNTDHLLEGASSAVAMLGNMLHFHENFFNAVFQIVQEDEMKRAIQLQQPGASALNTPHVVPFSLRVLIRTYRTLVVDMFPTSSVMTSMMERAFSTAFDIAALQTRNVLCYGFDEAQDSDQLLRILGPGDRLTL